MPSNECDQVWGKPKYSRINNHGMGARKIPGTMRGDVDRRLPMKNMIMKAGYCQK